MKLSDIKPIREADILASLPPPEEMSVEQLRALCEVIQDIRDRQKKFAIRYFEPQAHQDPFFRSGKKIRLITGSNQGGKSLCGGVEGIMLSLGIHPHHNLPVPNHGRVVGTDLKHGIGEVVQEIYEKYVPASEVAKIKKYPGGEYQRIVYKNGSTVDFMSYEQDTMLFEGAKKHWAHFDEPPPREIFVATMRGLMRYKGIAWITMTPLSEPWIYDDIFTNAGPGPDQPDVFVFDITQNKYLDPAQVADFSARLTDDEREARLHGRFKHLSGLIFKELNPQVHYIEPFDIPAHWTRYCAMDYHPRVPCATIWIAMDPQGRAYVYDELWVDKTVGEIAEVIKGKEGKDAIRARFIDSLSAMPDRITGSSPQREFARHGLHFRSATKTWSLGKNAICEALKLGKDGKPGLMFMRGRTPRCTKAFERYQWDDVSGSSGTQNEKPGKNNSHFPEAVRYIMVMRPAYRPAETQGSFQQASAEYRNKITGYSYGAP